MKISNYKKEISVFVLAVVLTLIVLAIKDYRTWNKASKNEELNGLDGYFDNVKDLDDLKKQYRELSKIYHPDKGGSTEMMQELNSEYEKVRKRLKKGANLTDEESDLEDKVNDIYKDIINELVAIEGIEIELIGSWIWISGETYPIKEILKELGFKYSSNKKMWYWHTGEFRKKSYKTLSIDDIRNLYESKRVKKDYGNKKLNRVKQNLAVLQGYLYMSE